MDPALTDEDESRVLPQDVELSITPTFLLAERFLMCRGSRNRESHTEPDHRQ